MLRKKDSVLLTTEDIKAPPPVGPKTIPRPRQIKIRIKSTSTIRQPVLIA
jgi:hypothetical protein